MIGARAALLAAVVVELSTGAALAAPPGGVSLAARPVFGTDAAAGEGWVEIVVRVDNAGSTPTNGDLTVSNDRAYAFGSSAQFVARAPFAVGARSSAVVHLPVALDKGSASLSCVATSAAGAQLAEASLTLPLAAAPLLVDADAPSRLATVLRGWPMSPAWLPGGASRGPTPLTVAALETDATTGDAVLPQRAAGYAPATAALFPSDRLAALRGPELAALLGWVLGGGTLAVFPTRPEDLRAGVLTTLAGGAITPAPAPPVMLSLPSVVRPPTPDPLHPDGSPSTPPPAAATPIGWFVPTRTTTAGPAAGVGPGSALRAKLVGFRGGNLRPSALGATAAYGLGQVHVLGFDPTTPPALEDGWAHARLLDMLEDAWDRHALLAFPEGAGDTRASNASALRRSLDPNEKFRPALAVAAVLLVLYSILSGPWLFARARKRGRPLAPLVWAPIASLVTFGLVVLVGRAAKGWSGRARHLTLIEAGAGVSRGTARRFRSFFASETRAMRVRGLQAGGVLDVLSSDSRDLQDPVLRVDESGPSLENLTSLPWQTVVVSEDGFGDLGAGVAVHQEADGEIAVVNHSGRTLRDVVVWAPRPASARWFASLADGARLNSSSGHLVFAAAARTTTTSGTRFVHLLDTASFAAIGPRGAAMAEAWSPLGAAAAGSVDWWPDDIPVVQAEIDGGDGATVDTGLRVESSHLMVRILGEGGAE